MGTSKTWKTPMLKSAIKSVHDPIYRVRLKVLVSYIIPHLLPNDHVLDVGCGYGALGRALLDSPSCPAGVTVVGLERIKRGAEAIPVDEYDGETIPHSDASVDVVLLADVLHHEPDPHRLIAECARVARRLLIIKDHKIDGPLAWSRIALLDWAANAPYGVTCLYRYNTKSVWTEWAQRHNLQVLEEVNSMRLYPHLFNVIFGGRLQYMAFLRPIKKTVSRRCGDCVESR
jgi:SAM-dependent methyltransferase